jgi:hypothetical protein
MSCWVAHRMYMVSVCVYLGLVEVLLRPTMVNTKGGHHDCKTQLPNSQRQFNVSQSHHPGEF